MVTPTGRLLALCFIAVRLFAFQSGEANPQLQEARRLLTGEPKFPEEAKRVLLDILHGGEGLVDGTVLSYTYVYLGYIEDRAGHRQPALDWYKKAIAVEGGSAGIVDVARAGLQRPITWIRHLDSGLAPPRERSNSFIAEPAKITKAFTTDKPPAGLTLKRHLSAADRRENFEALWSMIDAHYAQFKLKPIDWADVGRRYRARLDTLTGDDDFYLMMFQLVNELKDTHSWLENYKPPALTGVADMPIDMFQGKPFVVAGAKAGWEVLSVDGMTVAEKIESLRPQLHACSSERAFERQAGQLLLAGKWGDRVTVTLRSPEGRTETLDVNRASGGRLPARTVGFPLTRQRYVDFGRLPSGLGYIRIDSFNGRFEIAEEFDRALDSVRDTPGMILDIRDNAGGFGHQEIVGRFLRKRTLTSIGYIKSGPRHDALDKHKSYSEPTGKWQYTRPVALLVNDVTGSAADLFACELRSAGRVVTVGTTTHGNLSGVAIYAVLPCGLAARISNGYVGDAKDRAIEVTGNVPDTIVETTIFDFLNHRDPVLDRAVELLKK